MVKQSPIKYTLIDTVLGQILAVRSEQGLRKISIHTSRRSAIEQLAQQFPQSTESPDGFGDLPQRLEQYTRGKRIIFNDRLDFGNATPFQRAVWEAAHAIPYGGTRTYEWIAQRIGRPRAARAVGQALKRNPLPIIVPCHRVIGKEWQTHRLQRRDRPQETSHRYGSFISFEK